MIYNHRLSYDENADNGPFFEGTIPNRPIPPRAEWHSILGYEVMSPVGVFSCPFVTNVRGMKLASELGYDLITWKSIRSKSTSAHPFPHVTYVQMQKDYAVASGPPTSAKSLATATSIGIASYDFEDTMQQMAKGRSCMRDGQLFISSIFGVGQTEREMIEDFVYLASRVKEAGAQVVEANLSCPNVKLMFYENPQFVYALSAALVSVLNDTPLTLKIGLFSSKKILGDSLNAAARGGAHAITSINSVSTKILNTEGSPYFDKRIKAGVSGAPILSKAVAFVREAKKIITQNKLGLTILGGGGITLPSHIDLFFEAGADAAMAGSGALYNPYLMHEYRMIAENRIQHTTKGGPIHAPY